MSLGIMKEHFPLHDLYKREQANSDWDIFNVLMMSILGTGSGSLSNVNAAFYYFGPNLGYLIAFALSVKSWLHIYIFFYIISYIPQIFVSDYEV